MLCTILKDKVCLLESNFIFKYKIYLSQFILWEIFLCASCLLKFTNKYNHKKNEHKKCLSNNFYKYTCTKYFKFCRRQKKKNKMTKSYFIPFYLISILFDLRYFNIKFLYFVLLGIFAMILRALCW